eukprot:PITA_20178
MYLASSSSTHVDNKAWLIDLGASFHITPPREWFCEYEKYDGGVFLGDVRKARIIGHRKVRLKFQGGRIRTLPGVLHIPPLARNMIFVSKLDDADVKTVFNKDTYKMVRGALILMQGVWIAALYKLQGSTTIDGCNSSVVPESGAENLVVSREKIIPWHQRIGHIGEKGLQILHGKDMVEASIRLLFSVVAAFDFEVEQMDVKTTFIHGDVEEEIYLKQPKYFMVKGKKELVCKLEKSTYGLK